MNTNYASSLKNRILFHFYHFQETIFTQVGDMIEKFNEELKNAAKQFGQTSNELVKTEKNTFFLRLIFLLLNFFWGFHRLSWHSKPKRKKSQVMRQN